MTEHLIRNLKVDGLNPATGTGREFGEHVTDYPKI